MKLRSHLFNLALLIACGASTAGAQETWDAGFKLAAGNFSGAEDAGIGQSKNYGLAMFGIYMLSRNQSLEFDGGYRYFPTATTVNGESWREDKTDGYYVSALYRWGFRADQSGWRDNLYAHVGLRATQFRANRHTTYGDGAYTIEVKGPYSTAVKPMIGIGARLTGQYSVELNLVGFETANISGAVKSGTIVELALGIHM